DEGRLLQKLLRHGTERPEAEALVCGTDHLSWAELRSRVLRLAGAVSSHVAGECQRVALVGGVSAANVSAYLATIAAGHCAVPLPTSLEPDALAGMIENCEPALVLADPAHVDVIA